MDVALARLAAQRLLAPLPTAAEVVTHLTCVQAQDLRSATVAVALRSASRTVADVEASCTAGAVVRSWPMRGTLHLVPAVDLGWMLSLTAERTISGSTRRREELGLTAPLVARAERIALDALDSTSLSRDDLVSRWDSAGLLGGVQGRSYHLLFLLAQRGVLCFGPFAGGSQSLVRLDQWVAAPRRLGRDEALAEWALRYFVSHGPATLQDLVWWTGLRVADARAGLEAARPSLAATELGGVEYLHDPSLEVPSSGGVLLVPAFDELLLGYRDRTATLPATFADRVVPGGNGVFRPLVVSDGVAVGTWSHRGTGRNRRVEAVPFTSFDAPVAAAVPGVYSSLPV